MSISGQSSDNSLQIETNSEIETDGSGESEIILGSVREYENEPIASENDENGEDETDETDDPDGLTPHAKQRKIDRANYVASSFLE